jgi:uncharacterized protein involved in copper resistance
MYEFLNPAFLKAMDDIGRYGNDKYGKDSFHQRSKAGDKSRGTLERAQSEEIAKHAADHFMDANAGIPHDHFGTRTHQLAAVAFNAMMEYYFAGLEEETANQPPPSIPAS